MVAILILYVACGLILVLVAIPLRYEKIPPNSWYGFRLPATLSDPRIWYAVNKHSAARLIAAGVGTSLSALAFFLIPGLTIDTYALACLAVCLVGLLIGLVQSVQYMRQLVRERDESE